MATLAQTPSQQAPLKQSPFSHWSEGVPEPASLAHIPGEKGWPVVGHTFTQLADPHAFTKRMVETYGKVYKTFAFGGWGVSLIGADANELVLFNKEKLFSS